MVQPLSPQAALVHIADWFAAPNVRLLEEAIRCAQTTEVEGTPVRVMQAEHLVAIALTVGRAKDFSRILQFIEAGILDLPKLDEILTRHHLQTKWESFVCRFLISNHHVRTTPKNHRKQTNHAV